MSDFQEPFDLYRYECDFEYSKFNEENTRLELLWYDKWTDSDTHVGVHIIFFDKKPIGFIHQGGRKCSKEHWFTSVEDATQMKDYLMSYVFIEPNLNIIPKENL